MPGKLLIPIDGYIEAQETWHKMKKHVGLAAKKKLKKKGAPDPEWDGVFKADLTNVSGYAYAVAHHGRLVAEGANALLAMTSARYTRPIVKNRLGPCENSLPRLSSSR